MCVYTHIRYAHPHSYMGIEHLWNGTTKKLINCFLYNFEEAPNS